MDSIGQLALLATIPIYLIMFAGWMCRRVGWVTPEQDSAFMKVSVDLLFPCFIVGKMLGNPLLANIGFALSVMGIGLVEILLSIAIALGIAQIFKFRVGEGKRTLALSAGLQNYAFMVIPIVMTLYPNDGTLGVLLTHNVGLEIGLWTFGLLILSENFKFSWRIFLRGPVVATICALILIWTGVFNLIPAQPMQVFLKTLDMLGACAVPLSVFLVGTTFYDLLGKIRWSFKVVSVGIFIRNLLLPAVLILFAVLLPVDKTVKQVLVMQAAVPAAMVPIVLARFYGGQPMVAMQIVAASTFISLVSLPFWLSVGLTLLQRYP